MESRTLTTADEIGKIIGCTGDTIKKFLCRSEFSHIEEVKGKNRHKFLKNVQDKDIIRLSELYHPNIRRWKKFN